MKSNFKYFGIILFVIILSSCNKDFLDRNPQDTYSDPVVWSDISLAEYYLNNVYDKVEYGWNQRGHGYQTGIFAGETVLTKGAEHHQYDNGSLSPGNLGADRGQLSWHHYENIYTVNFFLANIDRVTAAYPEAEQEDIKARVDILKGEALFLRAGFYSDLCRSYGGVPLLSAPSELGDDFSLMVRNTFEETINFIAKDCDDAAQLLNVKSETVMGRAPKEAAMGLKSRMLLFAASDLTADGTAENNLVGYENPNRTALWTAARDAAKALIDLGTLQLEDLGAPDQEAVSENYYAIFNARDLSGSEVVFGRMHRNDVGPTINTNLRLGPNGNACHGNNGPYGNSVDAYQMEDGSDFFDHFEVDADGFYRNISDKYTNENPYKSRDPRFYASVLFDSAVWQPRFAGLADIDPLGIYDRRTRIVMENGNVVSERFGLDSRQGPFTPWNGNYSGYLLKKFTDNSVIGRDERNENIIIWMRYVEVLFDYAEASLELGDTEEAARYINLVRNRTGLPDAEGDLMEALRYERRIELFSENVLWYDIRRWKLLEENFDQFLYGVDIREVVNDGVKTTTWRQIEAAPKKTYDKKLYWIPIADDEINRAPQLVQNPGY